MPLNKAHTNQVFDKLSRSLVKLRSNPTSKNVHQFRTYSRRLQALLEELTPQLNRNDKRLHKLISRLRKRAGKIRDFDTQISVLRTLKLSDKSGSKAQLLRALSESRVRRARKLAEGLDAATIREVRKRLRRTAKALEVPHTSEPLKLAIRLFSSQERAPLSEARLHQYRLLCKRARYLAEFAAKEPDAQRVIEQLKRLQDALGEWHDWLTLMHSAQTRFGSMQESALVAAVRNLTRARFRRAVEVVMQTRAALLEKPAATEMLRIAPAIAGESTDLAIA